MPCSYCGNEKVLARGLCQACYHRLRRNGELKRKYIPRGSECAVEGCGKPVDARGLCQRHYNQADHPLKATWKNLRSRWPGEYPEEWKDFETFLKEVGARPSDHHQFRRPDRTKPWSKENSEWLLRVPRGEGSRKHNEYVRDANMRKKYRICIADYDRMLAEQGGVCAICGRKETAMHRGKVRRLAIDHCHDEGHVRGLLCYTCNQGIGYFQDSIEILSSAIAYLKRDEATLAGQGQVRASRSLELAGVDGE